jgi:tight adherence protein C
MYELLGSFQSLVSGGVLAAFWAEWGTTILVFLASSAAFFIISRLWIRRPSAEERRLRGLASQEPIDKQAGQGIFGPLTPALAAQIPESKKETRDFQILLRQAGIYGPTAQTTIYALRFVFLFVPLVVTGVWAVVAEPADTWKILAWGILTSAGLSVIPRLYVFFRRRRRMQRIRWGLPDTIDMLSMCTTGGLGLSESLEHVTGQMASYPELAQELTILRRQAEVGSLKQALVDFAARVDLPEVRQLTALLTRGSRLGTQLAGSLNEQADHLRTTRRQVATAQANKTPVKLVFPILFCFAPAALILLTGPALLELHDFLVPRQEVAEEAEPGEAFGTGQIIRAMQDLDQKAQPSAFEEPSN